VNARGGILGRKVTLKILNDNSSPTQVATNYQTLFASDHVDLAFGPFSSLLTTPSASVAAHYSYALVEGAGGAPTVFSSPANLAAHNVFDVGQVMDQAVVATGGTNNTKIIAYLHGGATLSSVQGPVKFDSLGQNHQAVAFTFQWQPNEAFNQVLPASATGSVPIINPKPNWSS